MLVLVGTFGDAGCLCLGNVWSDSHLISLLTRACMYGEGGILRILANGVAVYGRLLPVGLFEEDLFVILS